MDRFSLQQNFSDLFKNIKEEIVYWDNPDSVGISIYKKYPSDEKFIAAKTKSGKDDSFALVKIGYYLSDIKADKVSLIVRVDKVSKYLINGRWDYDENDPESPTRESLQISKKSKQPIDLADFERYQFNIKTNKIVDLESGVKISPLELVEYIYKLHIKTLSFKAFIPRSKMSLINKTIRIIEPIIYRFTKLNYVLFGRTFKDSEVDFALGVFKPYSIKDMLDTTAEKRKILGFDLPITDQSAKTFIIIFSIALYLKFFRDIDLLGVYEISVFVENNFIFQGVLLGGWLLVIDKIFPIFIFAMIDGLILFRLRLIDIKTKFK